MDKLVRKLKDAYEATVGDIEPWQSDAYLEAIARIQSSITTENTATEHWVNNYRG